MEKNEQQQPKECSMTNFKPKYKLHVAAGEDKALQYIWFENGYAYVTNGRVAVRAAMKDITTYSIAEIIALNGKVIKASVWRKVLEFEEVLITEEGFEAQIEDSEGILLRYSKLPDDVVLPDIDELISRTKGKEEKDNTHIVGYKVEYIDALSKVMGAKALKLHIKDADNSILVEPLGTNEDIVGILMPMFVNKE